MGDSSSNIIVIFGESFALSYSFLYGYDKITNPLLNKKLEEKDLILLTNVKSPATGTIGAFMYILNTKLLEDNDSLKWYKYPNIIEVLSALGYKTYCFSSQKEKGMYHNLSSGFSRICDEAHFTSNLTDGYKYDEELLNYEISESDSPSVVFYHLMDQHPSFRERYPDEFNFFKYTDYESEHPQILADYDNATLYNDYVVNSIIDKYKDMDAIVFYFSDYGLDIFETNANYAGHAKNTPKSQEISKKIPFMVYMSPLFQRNHPEKTEKIEMQRIENSVQTSSYLLLWM